MKRFFICSVMVGIFICSSIAVFASGDMAAYYTKNCASCHGADGSKSAMKSDPIKGKSAADIHKMMEGYKAGTFGKDRRAIMEGKVKNMDTATIKALSDYIATL